MEFLEKANYFDGTYTPEKKQALCIRIARELNDCIEKRVKEQKQITSWSEGEIWISSETKGAAGESGSSVKTLVDMYFIPSEDGQRFTLEMVIPVSQYIGKGGYKTVYS